MLSLVSWFRRFLLSNIHKRRKSLAFWCQSHAPRSDLIWPTPAQDGGRVDASDKPVCGIYVYISMRSMHHATCSDCDESSGPCICEVRKSLNITTFSTPFQRICSYYIRNNLLISAPIWACASVQISTSLIGIGISIGWNIASITAEKNKCCGFRSSFRRKWGWGKWFKPVLQLDIGSTLRMNPYRMVQKVA